MYTSSGIEQDPTNDLQARAHALMVPDLSLEDKHSCGISCQAVTAFVLFVSSP